jgi:Flp pilus assembly pilin Flp
MTSVPVIFLNSCRGRLRTFLTSESGATTAEYAVVASVVVALGVSAVSTTKGGANVTAQNTAAAIEAQDPMFDRIAAGQRAVAGEFSGGQGSYTSPGHSGASDPYDYDTGAIAVGTVQSPGSGDQSGTEAETAQAGDAEAPAQGTETEAPTQAQDEAATGDTQTAGNEAPEAPAETGTEDTGTETASDTAGGGGAAGGDDEPAAEEVEVAEEEPPVEEEEEEEDLASVEPEVKEGCENPYNKRGNIKKKCR